MSYSGKFILSPNSEIRSWAEMGDKLGSHKGTTSCQGVIDGATHSFDFNTAKMDIHKRVRIYFLHTIRVYINTIGNLSKPPFVLIIWISYILHTMANLKSRLRQKINSGIYPGVNIVIWYTVSTFKRLIPILLRQKEHVWVWPIFNWYLSLDERDSSDAVAIIDIL